jgi:hypothetical protein
MRRHGFKATYVKGCRCGPCSLAIGRWGQMLRDADIDIGSWWEQWFGDETDRRLVAHAKRLAEFEEPQAVAS